MAKKKKEVTLPQKQLLSYYIPQNDWKPTTPRGPVGAMYSSPGPAIVLLPPTFGDKNLDVTKTKSPAFKIGIRTALQGGDTGPGPAKYDTSGCTNQGKEKSKAPKIGIKIKDPASDPKSVTPGPGKYNPEISDTLRFKRAPGYTMGLKVADRQFAADSPGPNKYILPDIVGKPKSPYPNSGPCFSMAFRSQMHKDTVGPGPAAYGVPNADMLKAKAPAFSLGLKTGKAIGWAEGPGPLDYVAEQTTFTQSSPPKITFGIRHTPYAGDFHYGSEKA